MAKIIDPDFLSRSTTLANIGVNGNVYIDVTNKKLYLKQYVTLTNEGVRGQALYSFLKEQWKSDNALIGSGILPIESITDESFELKDGWEFGDALTINLIRDAGFAYKSISLATTAEYANITTLGAFNNSALDQAYSIQQAGGSPINFNLTGEVNQMIKIYGDTTHGNLNYRNYFKIFLREQGKTYDEYDLLVAQNISLLTYKKYALPLANSLDTKVTQSDTVVDAYGVTVTYYATPQARAIGASSYNFNIIINGNGRTKEQIYMAVQSLMRKSTDIDSGAGTRVGKIQEALLSFNGDTLHTKYTTLGGVFIDNFSAVDTNAIVFRDNTNLQRTFPFVASGTLQFNNFLTADTTSDYWLFFMNTFGTTTPVIVRDASNVEIKGSVASLASKSFTFDYDGNVQGGRTAGTDAQVTLVGLGLTGAQYAIATGTIVRSNSNSISLVSALERNYLNP